jgi:hydroxymethylpyrimidine/phosphomethylpyrimidine kinase
MKQILTIAGSDSGGGAGIQADIKSIHANGGFGLSVITSVTAQNTHEVTRAFDLPTDLVDAQIDAIFSDFEVAALKTGMLSSAKIVEAVAEKLREYSPRNIVVDPVMLSKSKHPLLKPDAIECLKSEMLPIATVVTPNIPEAELLAGCEIQTIDDAKVAAKIIQEYGCQSVLVKGGHLLEEKSTDVLCADGAFTLLEAERIETKNTHGTGCTYSAAIATQLGLGKDLGAAIRSAKGYITNAIRYSLNIGGGHGPTNHFYFLNK